MKAKIDGDKLIIPSGASLPPICVRSGLHGVPLMKQRWTLTSGLATRAYFDYFISSAELTALAARNRKQNRQARIAVIIGVVLVVALSLAFGGGSAAALRVMAALGILLGATVTIGLRLQTNAQTKACIDARLSADSFGFGTDAIVIARLRPEILHAIEATCNRPANATQEPSGCSAVQKPPTA